MSTFLRERAKGVADNVIAAVLLWAGSAVLAILAKYFALSLGVPPFWSYAVGIVAFLLIAMAVALLLKPKKPGKPNSEPVTAAPPQNLNQSGIHFAPEINVNPHIEVHASASAQSAETPPFVRPAYKVTVPVTSYPGLVRLDLNLFQRTKPAEDRSLLPDSFLPILAEFENLPLQDGSFGEIKDVWAQIRYREFDFLGIELVRVSTGCWLEQAVPDVPFPLRTPRYLILGGWRVFKGRDSANELCVFEYLRELHRAVEKTRLPGPRKILVDKRRIVIDVVLTSNGHHGASCEYQFQLTIFGPTGYSINCVKRPSLS